MGSSKDYRRHGDESQIWGLWGKFLHDLPSHNKVNKPMAYERLLRPFLQVSWLAMDFRKDVIYLRKGNKTYQVHV